MTCIYSGIDTAPLIRRTELKQKGSLLQKKDRELLVMRGVFGAWAPDGRVSTDTLVRRGPAGDFRTSVAPQCPTSEIVETVDEEVLWAGFTAKHYGHFLIESVARLWPLVPDGTLVGRRVVLSGQSVVILLKNGSMHLACKLSIEPGRV
jgi:hypothetical protein